MFRSLCPPISGFLYLVATLLALTNTTAVASTADHLIISEVMIKTRAPVSTFGSPFIEITNPTASTIPLGNVYLTDGTTSPSVYYYNITLLDPANAVPGGGVGGDFHAKFPATYSIAPGDTIVIALNGSSQYQEAYGRIPDFELYEEGLTPDTVPEMLEAFPGSINAGLGGGGNIPVLSDVAESLVLYTWNETADNVLDLDYLMWGTNTVVRVDKTGVSINGFTYRADTPVASQESAASTGPSFGSVFRRISADEGTETTSDGNGPTGHDETSENLATTFPIVVGSDPPQANFPFPAAPIFMTASHSPAEPYEGQLVTLSASVIDQDEVQSVLFLFNVDGGTYQGLAGIQTGPDEWSATIPAQMEAAVVTWYALATNSGGATAIYPAGSPNFAASWTVGAYPGGTINKLLLTEISTTGTDQEYIEVFNPGSAAVDLSDYYLTDANYAAGNQHYYRIGEGNPTQTAVGGGAFADFHARFPHEYSIAAGDTIVITVAGSQAFFGVFGFYPDLELYEDDPAPDAVPDMRWIFGAEGDNSIVSFDSTPSLANSAETVILYHFVEGENKVTDIDVFTWKDPSSTTTSHYFNKTGVTIGSHSYLPEIGTNESDAFGTENVFGNSYQRIDGTEGDQIPTGSNGVDGRDETSEDLDTTFASLPYDPSGPELPLPDPPKLLLTEISTTGFEQEYIEIFNPGTGSVDLSDFYLTDANYSTGNQYYYRIGEGNPTQINLGGGAFSDFHARFPDAYFIAAGDTLVVSVAGSQAFFNVFGFHPDLELYEDDPAPDTVPDMRWIFGTEGDNSIVSFDSTPSLTNSAETVILYHFVEGENKVTDIDVFTWKDPSSTTTSHFFNKTGVTIGNHSYLPETGTNDSDAFGMMNQFGNSYQRLDPTEGDQTPTGSNGVNGRDETSEDLDTTFAMLPYDPPRPPVSAPGPPKLLLTEISTTGTDQEYIEICNPGSEDVDLSDYYLTDAIYSPGNQVYWRIAEGNPDQTTIGGGAFFDFHARFPEGYSLAAGDTIVITIPGSDAFYSTFQAYPHLEMYEDGAFPDTIPDMRWVFGDETNNSIINRTGSGTGQPSVPGLTNGGETVVLYHWLSGEDKVTDIDVFAYMDPDYTSTSYFFNKTGATIGGHAYLPEVGTNDLDAFGAQNQFGDSYQRTGPTEGDQTPTGSNGVDGRDETSENFNSTFAMLPYDPFHRPAVIVPPEGDWQNVGAGYFVNYPSVAHTWGDFDNNGNIDLILVPPGAGASSALIHDVTMFNSGAMEFLDGAPATASVDCVSGDLNQDFDLDLFVPTGEGIDWFYHNGGEEWNWGLWGLPMDAYDLPAVVATTDAQMIDTDLDGWPELFVSNGSGNNQLLDGRFGMTDLMPHSLFHDTGTYGSAWCDIDGDRDPDLAFVAAEGVAIAVQDDVRRFTTTWMTAPQEARDIAWADYDNDGDFDFALTCLGADNVLFENVGGGDFVQTPLVHAGNDSTTGCAWGDFDNDGFLDLHVTNLGEPNVLWHNDGGGLFTAVEDTVINFSGDDLGASWIDIDKDGDLDLYVSNRDQVNRLVRNNLVSSDNWLQVEVVGHHYGHQSNFAALGAVIEVEAGGEVHRRYIGGQEAGPGHSPLVQHIGLGAATVVDRVTVHWPFRFANGSFHNTELTQLLVNQRLTIEETVYGVSDVEPVPQFRNSLMEARPNPFNPVTRIGYTLERDAVVNLDIFDVRGRLVRHLVRSQNETAGPHQVEWRGKTENGSEAASGVYIYRITAGDFTASRRMVLIK